MTDLFEDLLEGRFESVTFPVSKCEGDEIVPNAFAEHSAYGRAGADLEPLLRRARRGVLEIPFFADVEPGLWPDRYRALVRAVEEHPLGTLHHPFDGVFEAGVKLERMSDPGERSGVRVKLTWVEHRATVVSASPGARGGRVAEAPGAAQAQATAADQAAADYLYPTGATAALRLASFDARITYPLPTRTVLATQLAYIEMQDRTHVEIRAALDLVDALLVADLAAAVLATALAHDPVVQLVALQAKMLDARARYLPNEHRSSRYTVPGTMALFEIAQAVYGDAGQASLLLQANAIADPFAVRAGRVLICPPL
jgi:hypothetical protein